MEGAFSIVIDNALIKFYFSWLYLKFVLKCMMMLLVNFFRKIISNADGFFLYSRVSIFKLVNLIVSLGSSVAWKMWLRIYGLTK